MRDKVKITARAAKERINRELAPDLRALKTARTPQAIIDHGKYYVVDFERNYLVHRDVNLEEYGQKLGVIHGWESVA
jgi:hypothetical protein